MYRRSKKVVFFFPAFSSTEATAPLGILAVSTPLLRAGYQVCLIDSTITPNFKKRVIDKSRSHPESRGAGGARHEAAMDEGHVLRLQGGPGKGGRHQNSRSAAMPNSPAAK